MSDFLRELEEDIQEEKILNLWHKYGNYVIGLALAIIIATAGYTLWQYLKQRSQLQAHGTFSGAVKLYKGGKKEEALKSFQDIAKEGGGYAKLARLYEAALLSDPRDIYDDMAQKNATDPALGNLPKILLAARELNSRAALEDIQSLAAPNNAWAPLALELLAIAALKKGNEEKAGEYYINALHESTLTPDEETRISMMLAQIDLPPSLLETLRSKGQK